MPTHEEAEFATTHMTDNLPEQALVRRCNATRPGLAGPLALALSLHLQRPPLWEPAIVICCRPKLVGLGVEAA